MTPSTTQNKVKIKLLIHKNLDKNYFEFFIFFKKKNLFDRIDHYQYLIHTIFILYMQMLNFNII